MIALGIIIYYIIVSWWVCTRCKNGYGGSDYMDITIKPDEHFVKEFLSIMTDDQIKKFADRVDEVRGIKVPTGKQIFNVKEACEYLGCTYYYFDRWRKAFPFMKRTELTGETYSKAELDKLIKLVYKK